MAFFIRFKKYVFQNGTMFVKAVERHNYRRKEVVSVEDVLEDNQIAELFRSGSDSALNELRKKYC